ncbi:MAG: hypothetical protein GVY10_03050 [Verrucomicrobia bacterium]|jgi:P pilus assembly chaperone PapD|nr:hypothetical protein [Verrucomicrobiota bacterium]
MPSSFMHRVLTFAAVALPMLPMPGQAMKSPGSIAISPQYHRISLDESGKAYAYQLVNYGAEKVELEVSSMHWTMNENNRMVPVGEDSEEIAIDQWMVVNPVELEIPPGETRVVRFSFFPPEPLPPGEYRSAMVFSQKLPAADALPSGEGLVLRTRLTLKSAIYATVGEVIRRGELKEVVVTTEELRLRIRNTGTAHVRPRGEFIIRKQRGSPLQQGPLVGKPVLPGQERWISIDHGELSPGTYLLTLAGRLGDRDLEWQSSFELKAP